MFLFAHYGNIIDNARRAPSRWGMSCGRFRLSVLSTARRKWTTVAHLIGKTGPLVGSNSMVDRITADVHIDRNTIHRVRS